MEHSPCVVFINVIIKHDPVQPDKDQELPTISSEKLLLLCSEYIVGASTIVAQSMHALRLPQLLSSPDAQIAASPVYREMCGIDVIEMAHSVARAPNTQNWRSRHKGRELK